MTMTIKMQSRGVLTLPKKVRTRMRIDVGDMMTLQEREGGVFIAPVSRMDKELQDDIRASLEDLRMGRVSPAFSSGKELAAYMRKKRQRARGR